MIGSLVRKLLLPALLVGLGLSACRGGEEEAVGPVGREESPIGTWRAVLESPGGELPFTLELFRDENGLQAVAVNGEERAPFASVMRIGDRLVLGMEWYDSQIEAEIDEGRERMRGTWTKTVPGRFSTLPFRAVLGDTRRFLPLDTSAPSDAGGKSGAPAFTSTTSDAGVPQGAVPASIAGDWEVTFVDEDGSYPARGEFDQQGDRVTGTFLTATGDYRYLDGSYENGVLRLSTFDGAHAFLFAARVTGSDGLEGDFWSRDSYHATWTARRATAAESPLPDPWSLVESSDGQGRFRFRFQGTDGEPVSSENRRFRDKVLVVNLFGTWCPNCNDEAPLLAEWYRRYRAQGLEIVGLAFEFSGDPTRDTIMLQRFAERHGIEYPLLLAGTSDKEAAAKALPDLDSVVAYPTTIFIGRDGTVRSIYSGFSGPGTGEHHERLVAELEAELIELLDEET